MYRYTYQSRPSLGFGRSWTPMVRILILINGGAYLAQLFISPLIGAPLSQLFGLDTAHPLHLWRYFTYLFMHGGPFHLLFNMFALWMFGTEIEANFGSKNFGKFYILAGLSGAFLTLGYVLGFFNWLDSRKKSA